MPILLPLLLAAHATVPDKFGMGAEQIAMGGSGVSTVDDGAAAMMNPAGLGRIRRPTLSVGGLWAHQAFSSPPPLWWDTNRDGIIDERDPALQLGDGVDDIGGFSLHLGRNIGGRFGLGLAVWVPAQRLFRLKTFDPSIPTWIMYDNRSQRYVFAAGVGGQVLPGVNIGASVDIVPRVRFTVGMVADITATGAEDSDDLSEVISDVIVDVQEVRLDVIPGVAPVVGVQLDLGRWARKLDGLRLGATWRGAVGVPIEADFDVQANVRATDVGELDPFALAAVIDAHVFMFDHYVPMKVDLGASYDLDPWVKFSFDARWTEWRKMLLSVARVQEAVLQTPLVDLDDVIRDGNDHRIDLRSTWSFRAGAALNFPRAEFESRVRYLQVATQAGAGWEPTAVVSQGPESALLDASRWWLSGGLSAEIWDPLRLVNGPLKLSTFFQYHRFVPAELAHVSDTPRAGFSRNGQPIPAEGSILVIGGEFGFEY